MTAFDTLPLLLLNLALLVAVMVGLWGVSLRLKDVSFVDAVWPMAMLFLALITWPRANGDATRQGLLIGVCALWALRLGGHLFLRWRKSGADGRYVEIVENQERERGWSFARTALLFVFLPQAAFAWLVALPVQLGQLSAAPPVGVLAWGGTAIALFGVAFEAIGDAQLSRFKADPANRGEVMDRGLWRYTRHPNYFGDACVWWGLWLIAAETGLGAWSILGPIFLTLTLTRWSGIGITETATAKSKPGYAAYVRRTSPFIPLPPRQDVQAASGRGGRAS